MKGFEAVNASGAVCGVTMLYAITVSGIKAFAFPVFMGQVFC